MQFTVLEMTQSILSFLTSDEVNSIEDTAESLQMANILETVYYNIATRGNLLEHNGLFQLQGSDDLLKPVLMHVGLGVEVSHVQGEPVDLIGWSRLDRQA